MNYYIYVPTYNTRQQVRLKLLEKGYVEDTSAYTADILWIVVNTTIGKFQKSKWGAVEKDDKKIDLYDLWNLPDVNRETEPWRPEEVEEYFYVTSNGRVSSTPNSDLNIDKDLINTYNCFRTDEQAEEVAKAQLKLRREMAIKFAREGAK